MVRETSDLQNLENLPVEIAVGDLHSGQGLESAVKGCETIFHVAADYRLWVPDPDVMHQVNVRGTEHLLRSAMANGVERIIYTSSVSAVGIPASGEPGHEDTPVTEGDMIGPYKRSKFAAEQLVMRMIAEQGCPAVIVNPSTPIGPGDIKPTPTGRVIDDAVHGRMPAFVDTGLNIVHVDDVAEGNLLAYTHGEIGQRYILGSENISLQELLSQVASIVGRRPPSIRIPHRVAMSIAQMAEVWARLSNTVPQVTVDGVRMSRKKMYFSSDKAKEKLGYRPRPAAEAISDAVDWFRRGA